MKNVLTYKEDKAGYALLKCIASYLHIYMYVMLDVHTESTITAREADILMFQKYLDVSLSIRINLLCATQHLSYSNILKSLVMKQPKTGIF